jgi:hypothetical protein
MSIKTLKEILRDLEQDLEHHGWPRLYSPKWRSEAERFVEDGKVVSAVKVIRADTGWTLMECKAHADFYRDNGYWDTAAVLREIVEYKQSTITLLHDELAVLQDKLTATQDKFYAAKEAFEALAATVSTLED